MLIVSFSEIDSVIVKAARIEINDFKTQLNKLSARVDGIINAIKNGVCLKQDGGESLQKTIVTALPTSEDKEDFNTLFDYESD